MINDFLSVLESLKKDQSVRIITLSGQGETFCAGADLGWMLQARELSEKANLDECLALARCFHTLYSLPKITVAIIQGHAYGGANGLIAACDIALASESAEFAFSEVRLGLIPAAIAPYILRKTGYRAMELMISGRKFFAPEAEKAGLIQAVITDDKFRSRVSEYLGTLVNAAPVAQKTIKLQIRSLYGQEISDDLMRQTAAMIADARISEEAVEGMKSRIEKRKPAWHHG